MMVDLPMPGSPPTRRAEPGTSPPPVTRSNSAIPVGRRCGGASWLLRSSNAIGRPLMRRTAPEPWGGAMPSSVTVFQPPQASHLPDHLAWDAPQDWHTKVVEDLAMILL